MTRILGLRFFALVLLAIPAAAASPIETEEITLERLWVLDSEETLMGAVTDIVATEDRVLLLDAQLEQILEISNEGEVLRTMGRTGEGPGEYRQPAGLFLLDERRIGVLQRSPAKIAVLDSDGLALDDVKLGEGGEFVTEAAVAGNFIVVSSQLSRFQTEEQSVTYQLRSANRSDGEVVYVEAARKMYQGGYMISAETMPFGAWTLGKDGRLFVSIGYEDYFIRVFAADGSELPAIERDYESVELPPGEHEKRQKSNEESARRINYPEVPKASRYERDIQRLIARDDGTLWVQPSDGRPDFEAGILAEFDVFDEAGRITRRVRLMAPYDKDNDMLMLSADKLFVILQGRDAMRAMYAAYNSNQDDDEEDLEDLEAMKVVCYSLPLNPR